MSSTEILEWQEYFKITPTKVEQNNWIMNQLAILITITVNANRVKGAKAVSPSDFLPDYLVGSKEDKRQKSLEQQKAEALAFAEMYRMGQRTQ